MVTEKENATHTRADKSFSCFWSFLEFFSVTVPSSTAIKGPYSKCFLLPQAQISSGIYPENSRSSQTKLSRKIVILFVQIYLTHFL